MKTGMTTVTFRKKSVDEIISIVKQAGLDGIEWGGDVHVPVGAIQIATEVAEKCRLNGIEIFSYGSYYRGLDGEDFAPVVATAQALGASVIRIWAGNKSPAQTTGEEFTALVEHFRKAVQLGAEAGIQVALEYHRSTLTETKESAYALLQAVPNLLCYWQPNPDITEEEQWEEIQLIAERLAHIHVFQWTQGNVAHSLADGEREWKARIAKIARCPGTHHFIMEFVKEETDHHFLKDASVLKEWVATSPLCY